MHNGSLANFGEVRRDLQMAVDPTLFRQIEGSTDSETLFFLALTFGLTRIRRTRWPAPWGWWKTLVGVTEWNSRCT